MVALRLTGMVCAMVAGYGGPTLHALHAHRSPLLPHSRASAARVTSSAAAAPMPGRGPRGIERIGSAKGNLFSAIFMLNCLVWGALLLPAMFVASKMDAQHRTLVSRVGNFWGRLVLRVSGVRATVIDAHLLPPAGEPIMFVANHCSYLDIPVTGLLYRPLKYISKSEVLKLPVIGAKLALAKDLCVTRGDRRSEARVFIDAVKMLKQGDSILAFPEGTTTIDGTLLPFKRGPFKMAISAGVRVVPLTIVGTYDAWPKGALGPTRNVPLSIRVHPTLGLEGTSEAELCDAARDAVQRGLDEA